MKVIKLNNSLIEYSIENENAVRTYCSDALDRYRPSGEPLLKEWWTEKKYYNHTKYTLNRTYPHLGNATKIECRSYSYSIIETIDPPIFGI